MQIGKIFKNYILRIFVSIVQKFYLLKHAVLEALWRSGRNRMYINLSRGCVRISKLLGPLLITFLEIYLILKFYLCSKLPKTSGAIALVVPPLTQHLDLRKLKKIFIQPNFFMEIPDPEPKKSSIFKNLLNHISTSFGGKIHLEDQIPSTH